MCKFAFDVQYRFIMRNSSGNIRNILVAAVVSLMVIGMSSCGVSRPATGSHTSYSTVKKSDDRGKAGKASGNKVSRPTTPPAHINFASMNLSSPAERLLREADTWIGTPYLYGGNDRQGIDCSGFVTQVYRNSVGISLPRTSREQQQYCSSIDKSQLQPGDLVFFTIRGGSTVGHVGIYIGDDRMVHASSSKGVVISSLSSNYYVVNYYSSGRVEKFFAMTGDDMKARPSKPVKEPSGVKVKPQPSPAPVPAPAKPKNVEPAKVAEPKVELASAESAENAVRQTVAMRVGKIGNVGHPASDVPSVSPTEPVEEPCADLEDFFD